MPEFNEQDIWKFKDLLSKWIDKERAKGLIIKSKATPKPEQPWVLQKVASWVWTQLARWPKMLWEVWWEIAWGLRSFWADISKISKWELDREGGVEKWLLGRTAQTVQDIWTDIKDAKTSEVMGKQSSTSSLLQSMWVIAWGVSETIWDAFMSWLKTVAPEEVKQSLQDGLQSAMQSKWWEMVMSEVNEALEWYEYLKQTDPEKARNYKAFFWGLQLAADATWLWTVKKWVTWLKEGWKVLQEWLETWVKQVWGMTKKWLWQVTDFAKKGLDVSKWKISAWFDNKQVILDRLKAVAKKPWVAIEAWTEKVAWKILWSSSWNKELFKAASPSYQTLWKDKNIVNIWKNVQKADETVLKYWHKPVDTETRALAYKDSMKKVWDQVEKARWKAVEKVNWKQFSKIIDDEIAGKVKRWEYIPSDDADIKALKWLSDYYKKQWNIDVPTLWGMRSRLNAETSFKQQNPFGDMYNTVLKKLWNEIRTTENNIIWNVKGTQFKELMWEYRALAETYPDIVKANIKNMRAKGSSLEESFSRISGAWDIIKWGISTFTKGPEWIATMWKWLWKVALWKLYWKMKDPDFLVKEGYKKLGGIKKSIPKQVIKKPLALPVWKTKRHITTPQTIEKWIIQESKKDLLTTKFWRNINNTQSENYKLSKTIIKETDNIDDLKNLKNDIRDLWLWKEKELLTEIDSKIIWIENINKIESISSTLKKKYWDDLLSKFKNLYWDEKRVIKSKSGDKYSEIEFLESKNAKDFSNAAQEYLSQNPWEQTRTVQDIFDEMKDKIFMEKYKSTLKTPSITRPKSIIKEPVKLWKSIETSKPNTTIKKPSNIDTWIKKVEPSLQKTKTNDTVKSLDVKKDTMSESDLISEAKKYKSVDEFVKNYNIPYKKNIDISKPITVVTWSKVNPEIKKLGKWGGRYWDGIYFSTDIDKAKGYGDLYTTELKINNPMYSDSIYTIDEISKNIWVNKKDLDKVFFGDNAKSWREISENIGYLEKREVIFNKFKKYYDAVIEEDWFEIAYLRPWKFSATKLKDLYK